MATARKQRTKTFDSLTLKRLLRECCRIGISLETGFKDLEVHEVASRDTIYHEYMCTLLLYGSSMNVIFKLHAMSDDIRSIAALLLSTNTANLGLSYSCVMVPTTVLGYNFRSFVEWLVTAMHTCPPSTLVTAEGNLSKVLLCRFSPPSKHTGISGTCALCLHCTTIWLIVRAGTTMCSITLTGIEANRLVSFVNWIAFSSFPVN